MAPPVAPPGLQPLPVPPRAVPASHTAAIAPRGGDHAPALVTATGTLTHGELRARVAEAAADLAGTRRVVVVPTRNDVDSVVAELGAMAAGHAVLLADADDPGLVDDLTRRFGHAVPHPQLALLLATSGSTGAPKLVRLSHRNVASNAAAIVDYLGITHTDRALLTLPLHYTYGLSVLHSHLLAGAAVVLPAGGVVDPCTWELAASAGVTGLAGVPHTFRLLEQAGRADRLPQSLRTVTQAGGRMAPDDVRRWARRGRLEGFDFVVMYGQTEATARMAWLPPHLAKDRPEAIGVPLPGGSFRLEGASVEEGVPEREGEPAGEVVGELVYSGPNVMMGYAHTADDLAEGPGPSELHTGDLARQAPDGLWEIVGRTGRFAKPFGVRVDLDHLERLLRTAGIEATCVAVPTPTGDEALGVAIEAPDDDAGDPDTAAREGAGRPRETARHEETARRVVTERTGLPPSAVAAATLEALPRRANGKVDPAALAEELAGTPRGRAPTSGPDAASGPGPDTAGPDTACHSPEGLHGAGTNGAATVQDVYRRHFPGRVVGPGSTFVDLGGDSLTYIEASMDLESALGHLPPDWHLRTVADLGRSAGHRAPGRAPRRMARMEVGGVLRALGILVVVGRHVDLWALGGGAHVLMALSGHTFSRFPLTAMGREGTGGAQGVARMRPRTTPLFAATARVAIPTALWLATVLVLGTAFGWWSGYGWANLAFANSLTGPDHWDDTWRYWYVEALVHLLVVAALALSLPPVRRTAARFPFGFPAALAALALVVPTGLVQLGPPARQLNLASGVAWLFLLGWAAHRAGRTRQRLLLSAVVIAVLPGWFDDPLREVAVAAALLAVVWVREIPVPRALVPVVGTVGSASLWIYLTHWQVYVPLEGRVHPVVLLLVSVAAGLAAWRAWEWVSTRCRSAGYRSADGGSTRRRTLSDPVAETSENRPDSMAGR